jgi:tetratricopeptide (TPR) repeat protein
VYVSQERYAEAIAEYKTADGKWRKKGSKRQKIALLDWARALHKQKHYEQAAGKFKVAIDVDPDDPRSNRAFGGFLVEQQRFDEAIAQYRASDEKWQKKGSKDRKIALRDWADALLRQKHYEQASRKFQEAIDADPDDPSTYFYFGGFLVERERFDGAIAQYHTADEKWKKKESKDRKWALVGWARALEKQKHYEQASRKFQEAIDADPDEPWIYHAFGGGLVERQLYDGAIAQYHTARALWRKKESKHRKGTLQRWADALCWLNRYDEAAGKYQEAIGVDPDDPQIYNAFGRALAEKGLFDQGIQQYREAVERWQKKGSPQRTEGSNIRLFGLDRCPVLAEALQRGCGEVPRGHQRQLG